MTDMEHKMCKYCGGSGVVLRETINYVTREMAIDAGDRSYEGMELRSEDYEQCEECQGTGKEILND